MTRTWYGAKCVDTIDGPVPLWHWKIRDGWWWLKEKVRAITCRFRGHRWMPDCGALYCTRCHEWQDAEVEDLLEGLLDDMVEAKEQLAGNVDSLFGPIVDDEPGALDEECPVCFKMAFLSDAKQSGVSFDMPVCEECRDKAIKDSQMDSFDRDYERQRARGWED